MKVDRPKRSALDLHSVLNERFSPRAFSDRPVTDAELELLFEAARWAPSSRNEQPWRFLVTRRGGEGHAALLGTLTHSNLVWVEKAPVLVLTMVARTFARNDQENFHARHDLGGAVAQLTAQATAIGMGLHQLGGFDPGAARSTFGIPPAFDLVSVLAIGFPGDPESLTASLRERELQHSARHPLSELVHYGRFSQDRT